MKWVIIGDEAIKQIVSVDRRNPFHSLAIKVDDIVSEGGALWIQDHNLDIQTPLRAGTLSVHGLLSVVDTKLIEDLVSRPEL